MKITIRHRKHTNQKNDCQNQYACLYFRGSQSSQHVCLLLLWARAVQHIPAKSVRTQSGGDEGFSGDVLLLEEISQPLMNS
jgi:hypothetical protein